MSAPALTDAALEIPEALVVGMSPAPRWSRARTLLARAIYPEGFYNEDASREIDRLTAALERAQQHIREFEARK